MPWPIDLSVCVTLQFELQSGEVLVRMASSGVCHTDLHVWLCDWPLENKLSLVCSHEGASYVPAISDQTRTHLKVGDPGPHELVPRLRRLPQGPRVNVKECAASRLHGQRLVPAVGRVVR